MLWIAVAQSWTVVWSEDFEGTSPPSLPGGWSAYELINYDSNLWSTANNSSDCISGYNNDDLEGYFSTKVLCYDDAASGYSQSVEVAVSPTVWIGGNTDLRLSYDFAYEDWYDSLFVEVRFWEFPNWTLWTRVASYYNLPDKAGPDTAGHEVIYLTGMAAGKDSFQMRIQWVDELNNYGWGAAFDNFLLEGKGITTGLSEKGCVKPFRLVGRRVLADEGVIYGVNGRLLARFKESYLLPKGVFFLRIDGKNHRIVVR